MEAVSKFISAFLSLENCFSGDI